MSLAEKIQAAQASEGGVYLTLGEYEVTVQNIIYRQNTANSGECLIAELLVDQSNNDAHPVGAKRSSVFTLSKTWGAAGAKSFFYAVMSAKTVEDREKANAAISKVFAAIEKGEATPLNGQKIRVSVVPHTTKDNRASSKTIFSAV